MEPRNISIHSPRVGRGCSSLPPLSPSCYFNPLAPGGARLKALTDRRREIISIHSPRVGRGPEYMPNMRSFHKFQSTRPGWGEASRLRAVMASLALFQSTRPGWGEAIYQGTRQGRTGHFNPLAPGGARRSPRRWRDSCRYFNPLAPGGARPYAAIFSMGDSFYFNPLAPGGARRGCDRKALDCRPFQSTRPGWGEARRFLGHGV